ncbi:hypothetical protein ATN88_19580 [Enterovibrio coralii]|uniref:Gamma-glutamylcyclotransferase AIG2-like domain-containing protein n=1 Tax=Enterovibrio coralii TaxID=294935 RepID=A0A135I9H4_9GAMM|nr:hypothetical protein ATN88_19580 [Enterovibrio coralii]
MNALFVYGTLAPGKPNEHVLADIPGHWQPGKVQGVLHQKGWGAAMGFPGIELKNTDDLVQGNLFTSDSLDLHWDMLDEFEGNAYERVVTRVILEDESSVDAFIYAIKM